MDKDLIIKVYDETDYEQLKLLFSLCNEDEALLNRINGRYTEFTYIANSNGKVVGALFAWKSNFHPYCTYFRILTNPLVNQIHTGDRLLSVLSELQEDGVPFQTSIYETTHHLKVLYETNGFKEIRRTYMPKIIVSKVNHSLPELVPTENIRTIKEVKENTELLDELASLVKYNYEATHTANQVKDMDIEEWKSMILADDLVEDGSYVYLDRSGNVTAYSMVHHSEEEGALELGWCGADGMMNIDALPLLVAQQIKDAARNGFSHIYGEFDTTDCYAMKILASFPFEPSPTWITYQKQ